MELDRLLAAIKPFEEKMLQKGGLPAMDRPWTSPVPSFSTAVEQVVQFPCDDVTTGLVRIGWRGPLATVSVTLV